MRVAVLGHRGMLGSEVVRGLTSAGYEIVVVSGRCDSVDDFVRTVEDLSPHAVVNCIGITKGPQLNLVNSLLPQRLASRLPQDCILVHASTDAVFSGTFGPRAVTERTDATDAYGESKRLGELCLVHPRAVVLRTSILGLEHGRVPRSLLSSSLCMDRINGYVNHLWNGITTAAWADLCIAALSGELLPGLHQPGTRAVTKYELLLMIASVWQSATTITPVVHSDSIDRRLVPTVDLGTIDVQLRQLRQRRGSV